MKKATALTISLVLLPFHIEGWRFNIQAPAIHKFQGNLYLSTFAWFNILISCPQSKRSPGFHPARLYLILELRLSSDIVCTQDSQLRMRKTEMLSSPMNRCKLGQTYLFRIISTIFQHPRIGM